MGSDKRVLLVELFLLVNLCSCLPEIRENPPYVKLTDNLVKLDVNNMIPDEYISRTQLIDELLQKKLFVTISSTKEFHPYSPHWRHDSPGKLNAKFNDTFRHALEQSISNATNFLAVENIDKADYMLHIVMVKEDIPLVYHDLSIILYIEYTLLNNNEKDVIFKHVIKSEGSSLFKETKEDIVQRTLARERAAKENIRKFVMILSEKKNDGYLFIFQGENICGKNVQIQNVRIE